MSGIGDNQQDVDNKVIDTLMQNLTNKDNTDDTQHQDLVNRASTSQAPADVFNVIRNLGKKDDVVSPDMLDPEKLGDIRISANRGDVLNDEDRVKFERLMKAFCANVVKSQPDATTFIAFYMSMAQAALNQSTSMTNKQNKKLINKFSVGNNTFEWKTADFISFMKGNFKDVANPWRQYIRGSEEQMETIKATGKVESDGHLAAKHGTTSQFWNSTGDYVNGCRSNISDDDLAANYLQRQAATRGKKKAGTTYNVSQLSGRPE
uniref:Coat protein n=1 Tax=Arracacha latent virus C TaxID=2057938 RepID=A0A3Q8EKY0_9CLOS|nr:coat protein [Arracacha latent virus C]